MKRRHQFLFLLIPLFLLLTACADELPDVSSNPDNSNEENFEPAGNEDETLIVGISNNIDSMNPFFKNGLVSTYVQRFFYESILNMKGPTEFEPRLGEFTTEDNQTFQLSLVEDATWSDGEPVTTEDVYYTINTIADPDTLTSLGMRIAMIEGTDENGKRVDGEEELSGLEIIDDYTMTIQTKEPVDLNYLSEFLGFQVMIAPEHVFSEIDPADLQTSDPAIHPTVTGGPYEFVENKEDNYLHLTANENYYRGAPNIKDIYFRVLDGVSIVTELQSGNIDMTAGAGIGVVPDEDIPLIEEIEHLSVESSVGSGIQYMVINHDRERFQDPKVRRALAYAIDQEMAFENLLHGNGELTPTMYTSMNPYKNEDIEPIPYDPEEAKRLLEEANFDFSEPVQIMVPTGNVAREQMADLTQQWLQSIGMTVEQEKYDFTTWLSKAREGEFDLGFVGQSHTYEPNVQNNFGTGGASNYGNISDPVLDQYIEEGTQGITFEERKPIYDEMQEYFVETMPAVPLYTEAEYIIKDQRLVGGAKPFFQATTNDVHEWHFTNE
ncbi:MAG TPA: ABC transporter substrate-binding protein [Atopostipes sp.]|nr:ABC transporter substrate-binding protein [Atopostipes sp.]